MLGQHLKLKKLNQSELTFIVHFIQQLFNSICMIFLIISVINPKNNSQKSKFEIKKTLD